MLGIVKAPDKVMAETHKKTHFADVLKALSGARIFLQRQGKQRRQYLYGIVKLYDDVFAERVRSGECFQCGGEVQKKRRNSHDAVWCHFINLHVQGGSTAAPCFCLPLNEGA